MSTNPYGSYGSNEPQNNTPEQPANPYAQNPADYQAQQQPSANYQAPSAPQNNYGAPSSSYQTGTPYSNSQYANSFSGYQQNTLYGGQPDVCAPRPKVGLGGSISRWAKNIFHFSGRASRSEFWWMWGIFAIAIFVASIIVIMNVVSLALQSIDAQDAYAMSAQTTENYNRLMDYTSSIDLKISVWSIVLSFFIFICNILMVSLYWRRLQDAGYAGAIALLIFTNLGAIVPFIFAFFPSAEKGCKYDKPSDIDRP